MRKTLQTSGLLLLATFSISQLAVAQGGMDSSSYNNMAEHVNRGIKLMRANSLQAALSEFEAAKAIDAKNPVVLQNLAEVHNHMGYELFRRKSYKDAISEFEKCVAIFPAHNQARHNIALCKQALDRAGGEGSSDGDEEKAEPAKTAAKGEKPEEKDKDKDKSKDKSAEISKDKDKDKDDSPKIVGASGGATVTPNGTGLYMTGSSLFPVYSSTPSGASIPTTSINAAPANTRSKSATVPTNAANSGVFGNLDMNQSASATTSSAAPAASAGANPPGYSPAEGTPGQSAESSTVVAAPPAPAAITTPTTASVSPAAVSVPTNTLPSAKAAADDFEAGGTTPPTEPLNSTSSNPANSSPSMIPSNNSSASDSEASSITGDATGDKVAELEIKVYGKKNSNIPLKKRIEQLEIEEFGKERTGPMSKRVDNLIKAIGLH